MEAFSTGGNGVERQVSWLLLMASLMVAFLAVSGQSFWIDEANSSLKASQESFQGFLRMMSAERGSDLQMAVYIIIAWLWANVAGTSEFALRALNIPFFLGAIASLCLVLRRPIRERTFAVVATMASAFLWAYLDEARPYIMQFCGAMLCSVSIWNAAFADRYRTTDLGLFSAGAIILCASSLLGVVHTFFMGLLLLAVWISSGSTGAILRRRGTWFVVAATVFPMAALGLYYAWTLSLGAKASGVGQTNVATIAFALYEMLGFSGFGPGRIALREAGPGALRPYLPMLAIGVVPYGVLLCWAVLDRPKKFPRGWVQATIITAFILAAFLATAAVGVLGDFRVVGRHFMPVLPFLLLAIGAAWAHMWEMRVGKVAVAVSVTILFASALSQRFDSRFAKDDYRSAATVSKAALEEGGVVWWAADPAGANFYGVFPSEGTRNAADYRDTSPAAASVFFANNREAGYLAVLPKADVVVLSKTDIYDPNGALRAWMNDHAFALRKSFPAFTVWEKISSSE